MDQDKVHYISNFFYLKVIYQLLDDAEHKMKNYANLCVNSHDESLALRVNTE